MVHYNKKMFINRFFLKQRVKENQSFLFNIAFINKNKKMSFLKFYRNSFRNCLYIVIRPEEPGMFA